MVALCGRPNLFLTLDGKVTDAHDQSPMEDVSIYITEVGAEQWTDARGKFSLKTSAPVPTMP